MNLTPMNIKSLSFSLDYRVPFILVEAIAIDDPPPLTSHLPPPPQWIGMRITTFVLPPGCFRDMPTRTGTIMSVGGRSG